MRPILITIFAVAAVLVGASPVSAEADNVVVAGYGQLASGPSVGVNAVSTTQGVSGRLRVESAPGFLFVSEVTCVRVVGERVLVGGTIVSSTNPETIGHTSLVAVEDDGGDDRVGFAFSVSGLDGCPVFDLPMNALTLGNLVVVQ
jgi:hypothetical protein